MALYPAKKDLPSGQTKQISKCKPKTSKKKGK